MTRRNLFRSLLALPAATAVAKAATLSPKKQAAIPWTPTAAQGLMLNNTITNCTVTYTSPQVFWITKDAVYVIPGQPISFFVSYP